jgi:predicted negative regulator of RcsB-dependent stress response
MHTTFFRLNIQFVSVPILMIMVWFVWSTGAQVPVSVLDDAFERIGTPRDAVTLQEPWTSGYIMAGRLPALSDAYDNPFHLVPNTQVFGARFRGARGTVSPDTLLDNAYEMIHINVVSHIAFQPESKSLVDALERLQARHHRGLIESRYRGYLAKQIDDWPDELEEAMSILVQALTEASLLRSEALRALTRDEIVSLTNALMESVSNPAFVDGTMFFEGTDDQWTANLRLMSKVDFDPLFQAAAILADAVRMTRVQLQTAAQMVPPKHGQILLDFRSPAGQIIVGGTGINHHSADAALLVNLGGNNIYTNNAGGYVNPEHGISMLIDMSGDDLYKNMNPGSLGSAVLGVGMLIDFHGNDVYQSGPLSQGAAFGGVGFLYDEGGNDSFYADVLCQGAAAFGIGMSVSLSGDDTYVCNGFGQGFGTTLGLGVLVNISGNDTYVAGRSISETGTDNINGPTFAQGAGVGFAAADKYKSVSYYGGIGFLVDGRGHDQFLSGDYSQGSALFASKGLLLCGEGNNYYHAGKYSQGAAVDWSSAAIMDLSGDDTFIAGDSSQGCAVNHSTGILLNYEGDDTYEITGLHGQGHARQPQSLGLFLDYRGFDHYIGSPFVRGSVVNNYRSAQHILGVFIDHRGRDTYEGQPETLYFAPGKNNTVWSKKPGQIGIDTPLSPNLYFSDERALSRYQHYDMSPVMDLEPDIELSRLGSKDPFTSYNASGLLLDKGIDAVPAIVKSMNRGHNSFRRTMEAALGQILLEKKESDSLSYLYVLLTNLDPKTRLWALAQLSKTSTRLDEEKILPLLHDDDPSVRIFAADILSTVVFDDIQYDLARMAANDPQPEARLTALNALAKHGGENFKSVFRKALGDSNPAVHYAARNTVLERDDPISIGSLQLLSVSPDIHKRISSGTALIKMGETSGVPAIINAMEHAPRHLSPHESGYLLADFLAEYTGVDFLWDTEQWSAWWQLNETVFSLDTMKQARLEYLSYLDEISNMSYSKILTTLDTLQTAYPNYSGLDRKLFPFLRDAAKSALEHQDLESAASLLDTGLAIRTDDAEIWAVKAQYLHSVQQTENALNAVKQALEIEPDNRSYLRLEEIYTSILARISNE